MNYKVEKNAELSNAKIFVTLTQEEVNEKVKTLKEASKEEKDFFEEAVGTLLNECFVLAIKEEQLQIVSMPKVNTAETAFEFVIEVALYPEVKLNQYKGLVVEYQSEEVTPEEVNTYIQNELANKTMFEKSDREIVEENDKIIFDFKGFVDDVPFEGGEATDYEIVVGSHQFIPGFEEQLVGAKVNEKKDIFVTFPENYTEELKGKDAKFEILVHEILIAKEPVLDEEYVASLEINNVKTVEQYKDYVGKQIVVNKINQNVEAEKRQIFSQLINLNPMVLPVEMVEQLVEGKYNEIKAQIEKQGFNMELYFQLTGLGNEENLRKQLYDSCEETTKFDAIVAEIIKAEQISATEEEIEELFANVATANKLTVEEVKARLSRNDVEYNLLSKKALQVVLGSTVKTYK